MSLNPFEMFRNVYPIGVPIALSLTAYNAFLTGLIVLLKRRDRAGCHYFIASFCIFLWGVGCSFMLNNELPSENAQFWGAFAQVVALFIPVTWLHFVLVYTRYCEKFRLQLISVYIVTLLIFPFSIRSDYVAGYRSIVQIERYPIPGIAYFVFTVFFIISVLFSFWIFLYAIKRAASKEQKKDYCWVGGASFYGFTMGGLSFFPVYDIPLPQYNLLVMPLWQILLAYAMTRYQAFDMKQVADAFQREKLAAIGTMAASLNHELRNPLFVAKTKIEAYRDAVERKAFLTMEEDHAKSRETLDTAWGQLDRAMDIMQRFSDFARPYPKKGSLEDVEIRKVVGEVLELVSNEVELKRIQIDTSRLNGEYVKANRRQLEEIFFNLILNACHAIHPTRSVMHAGALVDSDKSDSSQNYRIVISSRRKNRSVQLEIADNGPGISPEELKQIFEPFYTTKDEGTGLGLYITKQLVEKNGGRIRVESRAGQGTRFVLEFPG